MVPRPSIVSCFGDQQRWDTVGCCGLKADLYACGNLVHDPECAGVRTAPVMTLKRRMVEGGETGPEISPNA